MYRKGIVSTLVFVLFFVGVVAVIAAEDTLMPDYNFLPLVSNPEPATPTPIPTNTPIPTEPPPPQSTPTSEGVPSFCSCTGPDLNCADFSTHNQAQACFNHCQSLGYGGVYSLDETMMGWRVKVCRKRKSIERLM